MIASGLVVAPAAADDCRITGLTLTERARRVLRLAGVSEIFVARDAAGIEALRETLAERPLVVVRADGWVVAGPLVEPLRPGEPGARRAVDGEGRYLGALRVDRGADVLAALAADLAGGDAGIAAEDVACGPRARHPARTPEERRRADAWQFELIHKPLDNLVTRYFYRTLSRPLTRLFLVTPITPNMITLLSTAFSLGGCAIAARAGYGAHVLGLALLVVGGVMDANDGEVARLRLEFSKLGGWLDTVGDELARMGVMVAVTLHLAPRWPGLPVVAIGGVVLALNVAVSAMIYWYCIFIAGTSNSQEYGKVLGVGPGVTGQRTLWRKLADMGSDLARRDVLDLAMLVFAALDVPEISFLGLVAGAVVGFAVVLPAHLRLVKSRRAA